MAIHHFSPHHSPSFSSSSSLSSSSSSFEQEDYIDLEVSSYNSIFHSSTTSPSREFEFHMTSSLSLDDMGPTTTSPADQLFYNGKLLPLQMLQKQEEEEEELYTTPFATPPSTPIMSCHVSRELVSEDYVSHYFAEEEAVEFGGDRSSTKLWTSKIKEMIRQSLFKTKLNIRPKSYVWSLFGKSGCSHQSSCATIKVKDRVPKRHSKVMWVKDSSVGSTSSSSSSSHSTRLSETQLLQRLHESPIQGAIKHCKQSQYLGTTIDGITVISN